MSTNFYVFNKTNTFLKAKTNIDNDADCFKMCGGARAANWKAIGEVGNLGRGDAEIPFHKFDWNFVVFTSSNHLTQISAS